MLACARTYIYTQTNTHAHASTYTHNKTHTNIYTLDNLTVKQQQDKFNVASVRTCSSVPTYSTEIST